MSTYALPNAQEGSAAMLECLAAILDPPTRDLLEPLVPLGGSCLELGAGAGSIAGWMAGRVGPGGTVVAADLEPSSIGDSVRVHQAVEVHTLDVRTDPFPAGPFDVIHCRLLWAHIDERDLRVPLLAGSLAPGGALVIQDWGGPGLGQVLFSPYEETHALYDIYQHSLMKMFRAAGNDASWAPRIHEVLTLAGLVDVQTRVHARSWHGGDAGCQLPIAVSGQVEDKLVEHGMTRAQLDELRRHLADPGVTILGNVTWSVVGRRRIEG